MKPKDNSAHIYTIICNNSRKRAAELIYLNGYAKSIDAALKIIDRANGVRNENNQA